jgi:phenylacetate-CoA ligase
MELARLFVHLPYPLKVAAASLRGAWLERWRYDDSLEERVAAAHERERWSADAWERWRAERLTRLLVHAARNVPYYRRHWQERRARGDQAAVEDLAHWPLLEKAVVRQAPRDFVAEPAAGRLFREHTSGSTGQPIELFWDGETVREWYALFEARCRRWHGVRRGESWAILGGQVIAAQDRRRPPFWVWNAAMRQLYLSSYHLAPELLPSYLEAMRRHQVRYLYGYSSALESLARFGEGHARLGLRVVLSNAEPLYEHQREIVSQAFAAPVRETYGMAELVAAASECPEGGLHAWPEVGVAEILDREQRPAAVGETGELVATGLLNFAQPLIRYRVGDRLRQAAGTCSCGRSLPTIGAIDGRLDDVLVLADGRRIGRLDPIFKGGLPLAEAQIVQETRGRLRLRFVPAPGYTAATEKELRRRFAERVGHLELVFEPVARIERSRNGKLRAVVCQLPPEERA